MTTDIRISVEFWDHPKTKKLEKRLGIEAVKNLQILWMWTAKNKPTGVLENMDIEDIELAARWDGDSGAFVENLVDLKLLDAREISISNDPLTTVNDPLTTRSTKINGVGYRYKIHDWRSHNPWAAESQTRSEKARFSRLAYVCPEVHSVLMQTGQVSITKAEYEQVLADYEKNKPGNPRKQRKPTNA